MPKRKIWRLSQEVEARLLMLPCNEWGSPSPPPKDYDFAEVKFRFNQDFHPFLVRVIESEIDRERASPEEIERIWEICAETPSREDFDEWRKERDETQVRFLASLRSLAHKVRDDGFFEQFEAIRACLSEEPQRGDLLKSLALLAWQNLHCRPSGLYCFGGRYVQDYLVRQSEENLVSTGVSNFHYGFCQFDHNARKIIFREKELPGARIKRPPFIWVEGEKYICRDLDERRRLPTVSEVSEEVRTVVTFRDLAENWGRDWGTWKQDRKFPYRDEKALKKAIRERLERLGLPLADERVIR